MKLYLLHPEAKSNLSSSVFSTSQRRRMKIISCLMVYTGSYNHTKGATLNHDENYIVIKDIGIAHIFETQFQKLWEKHK